MTETIQQSDVDKFLDMARALVADKDDQMIAVIALLGISLTQHIVANGVELESVLENVVKAHDEMVSKLEDGTAKLVTVNADDRKGH